jgi:hypothetical protein
MVGTLERGPQLQGGFRMKDWTTARHFLLGALLLLILPLVMRAQPILTPYALDHSPAISVRR